MATSHAHPYWKHCTVVRITQAVCLEGLLYIVLWKKQISLYAKMLARGFLKSQSYIYICNFLIIFFIPNPQGWNLMPKGRCLFLWEHKWPFPKIHLCTKYIPRAEGNLSRCIEDESLIFNSKESGLWYMTHNAVLNTWSRYVKAGMQSAISFYWVGRDYCYGFFWTEISSFLRNLPLSPYELLKFFFSSSHFKM